MKKVVLFIHGAGEGAYEEDGLLVVLRGGKRLVAVGITSLNLKRVETQTTGSGVVILTYEPAEG